MKEIFVLLLSAFPFFAGAQKTHAFTEVKNAISFNLLALAEIDFTALGGYEHQLKPKLFLSNEIGYIFASSYIGTDQRNNSTNGTGFLIRPSIKWFTSENNRFYLQPQLFYKQVTHRLYDWLGKDAVNRTPAYEELQEFKYRRKIAGFNTVAGFVLPLDRRSKGYIDLYFGIGVRYKTNRIVGEPRSVYLRDSFIILGDDNDRGSFPSLPVGIRFIYALN